MTFAQILHFLLNHGAEIYRTSEPHIRYEFDGAEGGKYGIWMINDSADTMTPNWRFGFEDFAAKDWEFKGGFGL